MLLGDLCNPALLRRMPAEGVSNGVSRGTLGILYKQISRPGRHLYAAILSASSPSPTRARPPEIMNL